MCIVLSRGKVLSRFVARLKEIWTFLEMKGIEHPEGAETEWLLKFYYIVGMTEHLNQLNVKMQGIGNTVLSLQQAVFAFENKVELFIVDLETGRLVHFENWDNLKMHAEQVSPLKTFISSSQLASHPVSYSRSKHALENFVLSSSPIQTSVHWTQPTWVTFLVSPPQICGWISSSHWTKIWRESHDRKRSWRASTCGQKWKNFNPKTSWLSELGTRLLSHTTHYSVSIAVLTMFGFTYACEQSFSHLKNITTNLRSRLTDESLNACVKLNLTKYQPDYKAISKSMQEPEVALMLSIITILFKIINSEAYFTQI